MAPVMDPIPSRHADTRPPSHARRKQLLRPPPGLAGAHPKRRRWTPVLVHGRCREGPFPTEHHGKVGTRVLPWFANALWHVAGSGSLPCNQLLWERNTGDGTAHFRF